MNIHEFGSYNHDILLMFHGSCMIWSMYEEAIKELSKNYHVIIPALPGHDPETTEDFTSVENIAKEMEDWLLSRGYNKISCIYGLSMGGSIVLRILANHHIKIFKAIVDGGITPYHLPLPVTNLIAVCDYLMVQLGRSSKKILSLAFPPEKYTEEGVDFMFHTIKRMSSRTIWRTFKSCNNYFMPDPVPKTQTKIQYWYGEKEKKARTWDIDYVKNHFLQIRFREIALMDHGEYCMMHQRKFAEDIMTFCSQN